MRPARRRRVKVASNAAIGGLAFAALVGALWRAEGHREYVTVQGRAMSTDWAVTLPDAATSEAFAEEALALVARLEEDLSEWRDGSPLAAVNAAAGAGPRAIPEDLAALVEESLELGRSTDGAFDVSWAALWGLWDFRAEIPLLPDPEEITRRRELVDFRRVELDRPAGTLRLPTEGMKLGLGGIAKGYALDRVAELLAARGVHDALVAGGGQVLALGTRGGRAWRIGLRDPRGAPDDVLAWIDLADCSLSTSADNESFFEIDGVRYHHLLDPRTGWPARSVASATVLHPRATLADGLSTALFVLGPERGLPVVERLGGEGLTVGLDGTIRATATLAVRLSWVHAPLGADGRVLAFDPGENAPRSERHHDPSQTRR